MHFESVTKTLKCQCTHRKAQFSSVAQSCPTQEIYLESKESKSSQAGISRPTGHALMWDRLQSETLNLPFSPYCFQVPSLSATVSCCLGWSAQLVLKCANMPSSKPETAPLPWAVKMTTTELFCHCVLR